MARQKKIRKVIRAKMRQITTRDARHQADTRLDRFLHPAEIDRSGAVPDEVSGAAFWQEEMMAGELEDVRFDEKKSRNYVTDIAVAPSKKKSFLPRDQYIREVRVKRFIDWCQKHPDVPLVFPPGAVKNECKGELNAFYLYLQLGEMSVLSRKIVEQEKEINKPFVPYQPPAVRKRTIYRLNIAPPSAEMVARFAELFEKEHEQKMAVARAALHKAQRMLCEIQSRLVEFRSVSDDFLGNSSSFGKYYLYPLAKEIILTYHQHQLELNRAGGNAAYGNRNGTEFAPEFFYYPSGNVHMFDVSYNEVLLSGCETTIIASDHVDINFWPRIDDLLAEIVVKRNVDLEFGNLALCLPLPLSIVNNIIQFLPMTSLWQLVIRDSVQFDHIVILSLEFACGTQYHDDFESYINQLFKSGAILLGEANCNKLDHFVGYEIVDRGGTPTAADEHDNNNAHETNSGLYGGSHPYCTHHCALSGRVRGELVKMSSTKFYVCRNCACHLTDIEKVGLIATGLHPELNNEPDWDALTREYKQQGCAVPASRCGTIPELVLDEDIQPLRRPAQPVQEPAQVPVMMRPCAVRCDAFRQITTYTQPDVKVDDVVHDYERTHIGELPRPKPRKPVLDGYVVSEAKMEMFWASFFGVWSLFAPMFRMVEYRTLIRDYDYDDRVISNQNVEPKKQSCKFVVANFSNSLRFLVWIASLISCFNIVLKAYLFFWLAMFAFWHWGFAFMSVYFWTGISWSFTVTFNCLLPFGLLYFVERHGVHDTYVYCPALLTAILNDIPKTTDTAVNDVTHIVARRQAALPIPSKWHAAVLKCTGDIASFLCTDQYFLELGC